MSVVQPFEVQCSVCHHYIEKTVIDDHLKAHVSKPSS